MYKHHFSEKPTLFWNQTCWKFILLRFVKLMKENWGEKTTTIKYNNRCCFYMFYVISWSWSRHNRCTREVNVSYNIGSKHLEIESTKHFKAPRCCVFWSLLFLLWISVMLLIMNFVLDDEWDVKNRNNSLKS